jgi:antitoxin (DNA-binding transcriptional repressor) of toxin-antitoxin stability system
MEPDVEEVSVSRLRQNLQAFLGKVRRGMALRVTSRGKVVAEIRAPRPASDGLEVVRARLRGSVLHYRNPTEPVWSGEEWDMNR